VRHTGGGAARAALPQPPSLLQPFQHPGAQPHPAHQARTPRAAARWGEGAARKAAWWPCRDAARASVKRLGEREATRGS
jgi:hypothetical protein